MHTSTKIDVYLSIASNPIIEHCSSIRFAIYPTSLWNKSAEEKVPHDGYLFQVFPNYLWQGPSVNLNVQDFSHIRPTPSPNWSVLPEDGVVAAWPLDSNMEPERLEECLNGFLPPRE